MAVLNLPLDYDNLSRRSFQAWNSDAKEFFLTHGQNVTAGLNATYYGQNDANPLTLYRMADGNYHLVGDIDVDTEVPVTTTADIVDLSTFMSDQETIKAGTQITVGVLDAYADIDLSAKTIGVTTILVIPITQILSFNTILYVTSETP